LTDTVALCAQSYGTSPVIWDHTADTSAKLSHTRGRHSVKNWPGRERVRLFHRILHTLLRKKTPTHSFFHISMNDV